jgi:hypothetical protein
VSDGTRTRDIRDHNAALYQLSYTHHYSFTHLGERLSWLSLPADQTGTRPGWLGHPVVVNASGRRCIWTSMHHRMAAQLGSAASSR